MKRTSWPMVLAVLCVIGQSASAQQISGSGSTFVFPIMSKWATAYETISGVHVQYQPIGSSGGVKDIRAAAVDFGASDTPLPPEQLLRAGLAQFPVVIGAVVPIVNLDGVAPGQLHLTGSLLADIFLGKVKNWNDPSIAELNPGIKLPDQAITVIHRADGSGTTFNWVDFLSKVSSEWKSKVGASNAVSWPVGYGGNGNGGVADYVKRVKGAIGYVEFAYVQQKQLTFALVRNRAGNFVQPGPASFQAATLGVDWEKTQDFYVLLDDAPDGDAYPIVATSFVLIYKQPKDADRTRQTLAFFHWALTSGQEPARSLDYVPLPPGLVERIEAYWKAQVR